MTINMEMIKATKMAYMRIILQNRKKKIIQFNLIMQSPIVIAKEVEADQKDQKIKKLLLKR
jgi:hypothetical protein